MSDAPDLPPIRVAFDIDDTALAIRIASLLAGVTGVEVAAPGDDADLTVVQSPGRPDANGPEPELTPRELDVLALLAEGASNKAIARRLGISVHTAKFHVGSLIDKLDAIGRTDVVAHAARLGVLNL